MHYSEAKCEEEEMKWDPVPSPARRKRTNITIQKCQCAHHVVWHGMSLFEQEDDKWLRTRYFGRNYRVYIFPWGETWRGKMGTRSLPFILLCHTFSSQVVGERERDDETLYFIGPNYTRAQHCVRPARLYNFMLAKFRRAIIFRRTQGRYYYYHSQ